MLRFTLSTLVAFLYYTSFASAMHHSPGQVQPDQLDLASVTIQETDLPNFFQNHDFGVIKKLKISHSKIHPALFKSLPPDLKELSLQSVKDIDGNMLLVDQFLKNTPYWDKLESLTLENQRIDDSAVSMIIQMPGLKNLNLSNNKIKTEALLKILAMQGLEDLNVTNKHIGSFPWTELAPVRIKKLLG